MAALADLSGWKDKPSPPSMKGPYLSNGGIGSQKRGPEKCGAIFREAARHQITKHGPA
jgi:hypothetical protein